MSGVAAMVVVAAAGLDAAVGEPPNALHPVAWFGRVVGALDREWANPAVAGAAIALALPLAAAVAVAGGVVAAASVHPLAGAAVATLALFATTSRRLLVDLARDVVAASETDVDAARRDLRGLAGRDADALSPALVRSAAVESAAENLADGLAAPLFAFAVALPFGLAAAAGAAAWLKAVNTLDSMLGYRSKPHGTASARLDDAAMWFPARAAAAFVALAAGRPLALLAAREWLPAVSSPNSGWPMGTLAAALEVRLEKPGGYVLNPGEPLPPVAVARRGLAIVDRASWLAVATAVAFALAVPARAVLAVPALSAASLPPSLAIPPGVVAASVWSPPEVMLWP